MRNFLLWTSVIIIFVGMFYYINNEQSTTDIYDEKKNITEDYNKINEEDAASNRNYDEPRVKVSVFKLYSNYDSNAIRAKKLYDGNLIEITGSPLKVDIAPDGDGIIYLADFFLQNMGVYVKGGEAFKSEAAEIKSTYNEITLLCYTDEFSIDNPILTDCIFDTETNSARDAQRISNRIAEENRKEEISRVAEENRKEEIRNAEAEFHQQAEEVKAEFHQEAELRSVVEDSAEKDRKIRERNERERIKADEARAQSELKIQNKIETEPYNTTYVDDNGLADSDYFD